MRGDTHDTVLEMICTTLRRIRRGQWTATLIAVATVLQTASAVTLEWDPSPDAWVAGYAIHFGTISSNYTTRVDTGNVTSTTISNLTEGVTYYFVATAYTADGQESLPSNEVAYTVPSSAVNAAPLVSAGPDQSVTLPAVVTLMGTVSDDGLPAVPGALGVTWTMVSGAGAVTFANAASANTTATFSKAGTYVLRLAATDGLLSGADDLMVTIAPANTAPVVNAGSDQLITLPASAVLNASVADDGLPTSPGAVSVNWTMVSGTGTATFSNAGSAAATASFSKAGTYLLRLTATDGALSACDELVVTVIAAEPVPSAPINLAASPWSDTEVTVTWTDSSTNETGFQVERSLDGVTWSVAGTVSAYVTSVRDAGLASGTSYYYRVRAWNDAGWSAASSPTRTSPFVYSYAQSESAVTATVVGGCTNTCQDDSVFEQLAEKQVGGKPATRYSALEHTWAFQLTPGRSMLFFLQAHQSASSDGDGFMLAYSTDALTYQDMGLVEGTQDEGIYQTFTLPANLTGTLYVRVRDTDHTVGNVALDSLFVDRMLICTDVSPATSPPASPVLQSATGDDQIVTLTWAASEGAASYSVWRRSDAGDFVQVASGVAGCTYTDAAVINGTAYEYVVTAINELGESEASNALSAMPLAPTITAAPINLTATAGRRKITLNWTQSTTPGVTQNAIYRSTSGVAGSYVLLKTIAPATTYADSVPTGLKCYYVVTAVSACGESAPSNIAVATAK